MLESSDPGALVKAADEAVARRDFPCARSRLLAAAAAVGEGTAVETLVAAGDALERLEVFGEAFRLLAEAGRRLRGVTAPEWDGRPLSGGALLVEQRIRDIGAPIRQARLLVPAVRIVGQCRMLAPSRLHALFARSFPEVEMIAPGAHEDEVRAAAAAVAGFETLGYRLAPDAAAVRAQFRPLRPHPQTVALFRSRWMERASGRPLIGISWASTNTNKEVPDPESWARFLASHSAAFVSLQYGQDGGDVRRLRAMGASVICDPDVRPLGDLDIFAAQVAAVDSVVTISNTTAHLAGALGMRTLTILDDKPHLSWPVMGSRSPWYPAMRLVRREGRGWAAVFSELARHMA